MADEPKRGEPQWLNDPHGNRDRARRSMKHEDRIAGKFPGGRRYPRSGGQSWSKRDHKTTMGGDVGTPNLHIEHKRTDKASMSLKLEWLEKVVEGAKRQMKDPALVITFEQPGRPPEDWIMVPLAVALRRLGYPGEL